MDRNFTRLLDALSILQRRDQLTTQQIADALSARGHRTSIRTVQRDLESLAASYPLVCDQRVRPYTWGWSEGAARISLPGMDWPEAIAFHMLSTYLQAVLPASVNDSLRPYFDEAAKRLSDRHEALPLQSWPERVRIVPSGPPLPAPPVKRSVQLAFTEAVLLGRRVRIRYQAFGRDSAKSYDVAPLGLVQHGTAFYVPARFAHHDDVRTIVLHRVSRAEMWAEPSGIEQFDLAAWLRDGALGFGGERRIGLVLRLFEQTALLLVETPLAPDQSLVAEGEGVHLLRAEVQDTEQLRRWLLSLGVRVEIVEPAALRTWAIAQATESSARYRPSTSRPRTSKAISK